MAENERTMVAWRLAAGLARARTEHDAAACVARAAGQLAGAESVRVWMIDHTRGYRFSGAWPDEAAPPASPPEEIARAVAFGSPSAADAPAPHRSRLVVPLLRGSRPLGAVELLEARRPAGPFTSSDADSLNALADAADAALASVGEFASRERRQAETVSRLARLYDVGRSLATTLDMDALKPVIVNRVQASLDAACAYLWLLDDDGERLSIAAAIGPTSEAVQGWEIAPGAGIAGRVLATGEAARFADPETIPDLDERPDAAAGFEILTAAAAPVSVEEGRVFGVIEVINKDGDAPFEEDDLAFLRELARSAGIALGNARRLDAERRAGDLGALLAAAQHLGATLDARKIALTLVHQAATVIRYRRAAVALRRGARLELTAVTGASFVDETLPEIRALREILDWASGLDEGVYVVQEEDGTIDADRPETREKFKGYFESSGSRSFLAVPLRDEEGRVGVFTIEAAEPYAFSGRDLEAAGLLAALATVAVRNAVLFEQIPMVRIIGPFARPARRFLGLSWPRRALWGGATALAAAVLLFVPVPLRIGGEARVLPEARRPVTAEVEGRIAHVYVREGDSVEAGQVLAVIDDAEYRAGAEDARARYEVALREQSRFRAGGHAADAAVETARLEGLRAEVDLWTARLDRTRIRTRAAGLVATPRVEETVGSRLERGAVFCEVVDPARQRIEIAVPEEDAGLVAPGMSVKVKLNAYPTRSFRGRVERLGVAATVDGDGRVLLAQARLEGEAEPLRPGMTGHAKVSAGPASIARVVLRAPARWIWKVVWGWLP